MNRWKSEAQHRYYLKNRDKILEQKKERREQHGDEIRAKAREAYRKKVTGQ